MFEKRRWDTYGYQEEKCSEKWPDAKALRMECPRCVQNTKADAWLYERSEWGEVGGEDKAAREARAWRPYPYTVLRGHRYYQSHFTWGTKKVNNLSKVTNKMLGQIIKWFENMTPKPLTHLPLWGKAQVPSAGIWVPVTALTKRKWQKWYYVISEAGSFHLVCWTTEPPRRHPITQRAASVLERPTQELWPGVPAAPSLVTTPAKVSDVNEETV